MYKGIQNPQAFLQNAIMQRNPQIAEVMNYIQQNGGDAQAAFYKYAQDNGVNPQDILNMLK